ncbi:hypothetical protein BDW69DRAFT_194787 [Aspergillus filifer]
MTSIDKQKDLVQHICQKIRNTPWLPISQLQKATSIDVPARGGVNIVKTNFPAPPSPAIRDVLYTVIDRLKKGYHRITPAEETRVQNLRALLKKCNPNLTILYTHGGGLYAYFPRPILDILLAYTSLLYPPPGTSYPAIPASQIVVAGNSAGGNLALMRLASIVANGQNDLLTMVSGQLIPPPGEAPYCAAATLDHEIVSPAVVEDCTGAPPMWFDVGCEERGIDGNKVVASQAAKAGMSVAWNDYKGMPHEFGVFLGMLPQARHLFRLWAVACRGLQRLLMPDCERVDLGSVVDVTPLSFEEVKRRIKAYSETGPVWTGPGREHGHEL